MNIQKLLKRANIIRVGGNAHRFICRINGRLFTFATHEKDFANNLAELFGSLNACFALSSNAFQKIALSAALAALMGYSSVANALPTDGQFAGGTSGTIATSGNTMNVTADQTRSIAQWGTFNIGHGETVNFLLPSSSSSILNRVIGGSPSSIFGAMNSNGNVFLMNPAGIIFGSTAQVNVGSLFASTLSISNHDFLTGNMVFKQDPNFAPGAVINQGHITAAQGGSVNLLGGHVENTGTINAPGGQINMAVGNQISLAMDDNLGVKVTIDEGLKQTVDAYKEAVKNAGLLQADGGLIKLQAKLEGALYEHAVNNTGRVQASSVAFNNGQVEFLASGGDIVHSGTIDVSGTASNPNAGSVKLEGDTTLISGNGEILAKGAEGGKGGDVQILGDKVGLLDNAKVDASGDVGGGTVLIGGDTHGEGSVRKADRTVIGEGAQVLANAGTNGNGGKVVAWGNDVTVVNGKIEAKGGSQSGDGGFVELSSADEFGFDGSVDVSAANGQIGSILFDPLNIIIHNGSSSQTADGQLTGDNQILLGDGGSADYHISEGKLESLNGDVTLEAKNDITMQPLTTDHTLTMKNGVDLTIKADADNDGAGNFSMSNADTITTKNGDIKISGANVTVGNLDTTAGSGSVTLSTTTNNGAISMSSGNSIKTKNGDITLTGGSATLGKLDATAGSGGDVTVTAKSGNITLNNTVSANNVTMTTNNGGISVNNTVSAKNISLTTQETSEATAANISGSGQLISSNLGNGKITLKSADNITVNTDAEKLAANADGNVSVTEANSLTLANTTVSNQAGGSFTVTAADSITVSDSVKSTGGNVNLNAQNNINVNGNITADAGDVNLTANGANWHDGYWDWNFRSGWYWVPGHADGTGHITVNADVTGQNVTLDTHNADYDVNGNVDINHGDTVHAKGTGAGGSLLFDDSHLLTGDVLGGGAGSGKVTIKGDLDNNGTIKADGGGGDITVHYTSHDLDLTGRTLDASAGSGSGKVILNGTDISNSSSYGNIDVSTGGGPGNITLITEGDHYIKGTSTSLTAGSGNITMNAGSYLDLSGNFHGANISATSGTNVGSSIRSLKLTETQLNDLKLSNINAATSASLIANQGNIQLNGPVHAGGDLSLTVFGTKNIQGFGVLSGDGLTLNLGTGNATRDGLATGAYLQTDVNSLKAFGGGTVKVKDANSITLNTSNTGALELSTNTADINVNSGQVIQASKLTLNAANDIQNAGYLRVTGDAQLSGQHINNQGTVQSTFGNVKADSVYNTTNSGSIHADGDITVNAGTDINNPGSMVSDNGSLTANANQNINNGGIMQAKGDVNLNAGTSLLAGSIDNAGTVQSTTGNTTLNAHGNVSNAGILSAANTLGITVNNANNITGTGNFNANTLNLQLGTGNATQNGNAYGPALNTNVNNLTANGNGSFVSINEADNITLNTSNLGTGSLGVTANNNINIGGDVTSQNILLGTHNGDISGAGKLKSSNELMLNAHGNIDVNTDANVLAAYATGSVNVNEDNDVTIKSNINENYAGTSYTLNAGGAVTVDGSIIADGSNASNTSVDIKGASVRNNSLISGLRDVKLTSTAGDITNNNQVKSSGGKINLDAQGNITNNYFINGSGDVTLTSTGDINNAGTAQAANGSLTASGQNVTNNGSIIAGNNIELNATQTLSNTAGHNIAANSGTIKLTSGGNLTNDGSIWNNLPADISLTSTGGNVTNSGSVNSKGKLDVSAGVDVTNSGNLQATGDVSVTGRMIDNQNTIQSTGGNVTVDSVFDVTNSGTVHASGDATVDAGKHTVSPGSESVWVGKVDNSGSLISDNGKLNVKATANIENSGTMQAKGDVSLNAGENWTTIPGSAWPGSLNNTGTVQSFTGNVTVNANNQIHNQHLISGAGDVNLSATNGVANDAVVHSGGKTTINSANGDITNSDLLDSTGDLSLTAGGNISNSGTAQSGTGSLTASGKNVTNSGSIVAEGKVELNATETLSNTAGHNISSNTDSVKLTSGGNLTNDGNIWSNQPADISLTSTGGNVANSGYVTSKGKLDVSAQQNVTNTGHLLASGDLSVTGLNIDNQNTIQSTGGNVNVDSVFNTSNSGTVEASGDVTVDAGKHTVSPGSESVWVGKVDNSGSLISDNGKLNVKATENINNSGTMQAKGDVSLNAGENWTTIPGTAWSGSLNNSGTIQSVNGNVTVNTNNEISNQNQISAAGDVSLTAKNAIGNDGTVTSSTGNITAESTNGDITNNGTLDAHNNLSLNVHGSSNIKGTGTLKADKLALNLESGNATADGTSAGTALNAEINSLTVNNASGAAGTVKVSDKDGVNILDSDVHNGTLTVSESGANGAISLDGNVHGQNVNLNASGSGNITEAAGKLLTGNNISLSSQDGNIGVDASGKLNLNADNLTLNTTTGSAYIDDPDAINLLASTVGGDLNVDPTAITVSGKQTVGHDIDLTASNSITLNAMLESTGGGHINLTANNMIINAVTGSTKTIKTAGSVLLQPYGSTVPVRIGGNNTNDVGGANPILDISKQELNRISAGNVQIGSNLTGDITIQNDIDLSNLFDLKLTTGGSIFSTNHVFTLGHHTFRLDAGNDVILKNSGNGQSIKLTSVSAGDEIKITTTGANSEINIAEGIDPTNVTLSTTGNNSDIHVGGSVVASNDISISTTGNSSDVHVGGNIKAGHDAKVTTNKGDIKLDGSVEATSNKVTLQTNDGGLLSNSKINVGGDITAGQDVKVKTNQGDITLGGNVKGGHDVAVTTNKGDVKVNGSVEATSNNVTLQTNDNGFFFSNSKINVGGNITAGQDATVKTNVGGITLGGNVTGGHDATVTTNFGNIQVNGSVEATTHDVTLQTNGLFNSLNVNGSVTAGNNAGIATTGDFSPIHIGGNVSGVNVGIDTNGSVSPITVNGDITAVNHLGLHTDGSYSGITVGGLSTAGGDVEITTKRNHSDINLGGLNATGADKSIVLAAGQFNPWATHMQANGDVNVNGLLSIGDGSHLTIHQAYGNVFNNAFFTDAADRNLGAVNLYSKNGITLGHEGNSWNVQSLTAMTDGNGASITLGADLNAAGDASIYTAGNNSNIALNGNLSGQHVGIWLGQAENALTQGIGKSVIAKTLSLQSYNGASFGTDVNPLHVAGHGADPLTMAVYTPNGNGSAYVDSSSPVILEGSQAGGTLQVTANGDLTTQNTTDTNFLSFGTTLGNTLANPSDGNIRGTNVNLNANGGNLTQNGGHLYATNALLQAGGNIQNNLGDAFEMDVDNLTANAGGNATLQDDNHVNLVDNGSVGNGAGNTYKLTAKDGNISVQGDVNAHDIVLKAQKTSAGTANVETTGSAKLHAHGNTTLQAADDINVKTRTHSLSADAGNNVTVEEDNRIVLKDNAAEGVSNHAGGTYQVTTKNGSITVQDDVAGHNINLTAQTTDASPSDIKLKANLNADTTDGAVNLLAQGNVLQSSGHTINGHSLTINASGDVKATHTGHAFNTNVDELTVQQAASVQNMHNSHTLSLKASNVDNQFELTTNSGDLNIDGDVNTGSANFNAANTINNNNKVDADAGDINFTAHAGDINNKTGAAVTATGNVNLTAYGASGFTGTGGNILNQGTVSGNNVSLTTYGPSGFISTGGDITNEGTISALNNVNITANGGSGFGVVGGNITNIGSINGTNLILTANGGSGLFGFGGDITNSGDIIGTNVSLFANGFSGFFFPLIEGPSLPTISANGGNITNSGLISASNFGWLQANDNINVTSTGRVLGADLGLQTKLGDITVAGQVGDAATQNVAMTAGHDVNVESTETGECCDPNGPTAVNAGRVFGKNIDIKADNNITVDGYVGDGRSDSTVNLTANNGSVLGRGLTSGTNVNLVSNFGNIGSTSQAFRTAAGYLSLNAGNGSVYANQLGSVVLEDSSAFGNFILTVLRACGAPSTSTANLTVHGDVSSGGLTSLITQNGNIIGQGLISGHNVVLAANGGSILDGNGDGLNLLATGDSTLYADGVIGTFTDPFDVNVTGGDLFVGAHSQIDGVSVDINGNVSPSNTLRPLFIPPGAVIFNGQYLFGGGPISEMIHHGIPYMLQDYKNLTNPLFSTAYNLNGKVLNPNSMKNTVAEIINKWQQPEPFDLRLIQVEGQDGGDAYELLMLGH